MQFNSKYDIGQEVFAVHRQTVSRPAIKCPACDDGTVLLKGERFECPSCNGKKEVQAREYGWIITLRGVVGLIKIEHSFDRGYDHDADEEIESSDPSTEVQYMLRESGIGSGTVYTERRLFPSRDAAQTWCDQHNGKANGVAQ